MGSRLIVRLMVLVLIVGLMDPFVQDGKNYTYVSDISLLIIECPRWVPKWICH